jgi:hypothetical protein
VYLEEAIIRSSIQVFMADPENPKPQVFGSGCLINYLDRLFFISVFHVTNYDLTAFLETNLPPNEIGPPIQPIGGLCSFDLFEVTKDMEIKEFEDLLKKPLETLDVTFAEVKHPITLLQPEMDFGAFKIDAGHKIILSSDNLAIPTKDKTYGFYGKIKHKYNGKYLEMTPTFKHSLTFHRTNKYFHMFLAPETIVNKEDYEGCSGAPILDSDGNIVALACKILVGSKVIYGFSIQECMKLLKISIETGML